MQWQNKQRYLKMNGSEKGNQDKRKEKAINKVTKLWSQPGGLKNYWFPVKEANARHPVETSQRKNM